MALLGQLHSYVDGVVLDSSDWNDEFNQIVASLGAIIAGIVSSNIIITGSDNVTPIVKLNKSTSGAILCFKNEIGLVALYVDVTGQIITGSTLPVQSTIVCPNLNADLLNGSHASALQQALFAFNHYSLFWTSAEADANTKKYSYLVTRDLTITKLKAKQEGVASANADTTIDFKKNGVSLGTVTISGNVTTVQTNDIGDIVCVAGDILTMDITLHDGTTKHNNITGTVHFKQKFVNQ